MLTLIKCFREIIVIRVVSDLIKSESFFLKSTTENSNLKKCHLVSFTLNNVVQFY